MKEFLVFLFFILLIGCGTPTKKPRNVIGNEPTNTTKTIISPTVIEPSIPKGAVVGNYNGDFNTFYATISSIDVRSETTVISFEKNKYPFLKIPKTVGGTISTLVLDGFDRDLLLVTAKLKDPNFNKYYLYVLRNNQWKPVINGFAIHKSNKPDTLVPLKINPNNPKEIVRYYSVFDLDATSELGYTWRLLQEIVPIENW